MSADSTDFNLKPVEPVPATRPIEPLYSMLMDSPISAIVYLHSTLLDYTSESELNDSFPEVGLTRRSYIEQVQLALNHRNHL